MAAGSTTTVTGGKGAASPPPTNVGVGASARRSSQSGTLFSGLINQKRNSSDATAQARRESFHDMKPAPGLIGKMWHNFTYGTSPK